MKKDILLLVFAILLFGSVNAQHIISLNIIPSSPADTQDVKSIVSVEFGSGDCPLVSSYFYISNDTMHLVASYNLGLLAVICDRTDTFDFGMLPCSLHTLHVHIVEGGSASGTTDGYLPLSISCTPTGIQGAVTKGGITFFPNPVSGELNLKMTGENGSTSRISVLNLLGEKLYSSAELLTGNNSLKRIDVSMLAKGLYLLKVETKAGTSISRFLKE